MHVTLDDALLFFDLAGTLMPVDGGLAPDQARTLLRVGRRARSLILVTGQPSLDPQVQALLNLFRDRPEIDFVSYVTRGGLRLHRVSGRFEPDLTYLSQTRLPLDVQTQALEAVDHTLAQTEMQILCPVETLDNVVVRVNLPPAERPAFAALLREDLARRQLRLEVMLEGRTSVFLGIPGLGKRHAVSHEINLRSSTDRTTRRYFFGNECLPGGNDYEVLGLPLQVLALGNRAALAADPRCHWIGEGPDDLYHLLDGA